MKCPICGTRLTIEQSLDHGYNNGDDEGMWLDVAGYCENCGKGFVWCFLVFKSGKMCIIVKTHFWYFWIVQRRQCFERAVRAGNQSAKDLRHHFAPGRGQDDFDGKASSLWRSYPSGGLDQVPQDAAPCGVGLDGD